MRINISATNGAVFAERAMTALAPVIGRESAARLIAAALEEARRGRRSFGAALAANENVKAALGAGALSDLEQPEAYLGAAEHFRRHLIEDE